MTPSPLNIGHSLIDASEQPLRRSGPGEPAQKEDWPVLSPLKPSTPSTAGGSRPPSSRKLLPPLEEIGVVRAPFNVSRSSLEEKVLAHREAHSRPASRDHAPIVATVPDSSLESKVATAPNLSSVEVTKATPVEEDTKSDSREVIYKASNSNSAHQPTVEDRAKVGMEGASKASSTPRQTRTSLLRAQISAATLAKTDQQSMILTSPSQNASVKTPSEAHCLGIKSTPSCVQTRLGLQAPEPSDTDSRHQSRGRRDHSQHKIDQQRPTTGNLDELEPTLPASPYATHSAANDPIDNERINSVLPAQNSSASTRTTASAFTDTVRGGAVRHSNTAETAMANNNRQVLHKIFRIYEEPTTIAACPIFKCNYYHS